MPSFNMADLDWLNLYSELASLSTMSAANPGAGMMDNVFTTHLTVDASETFTDFDTSPPFQLPAGCAVGPLSLPSGDVTWAEVGPSTGGYNLSGTNSSASSVNVGINIIYYFSFPVPPE